MSTGPRPFDLLGPLPEGVTVLEASAGTGKTYALAALAARYVADGLPLERLLLVSFTRMATGELRARVRGRLVEAERALRTGDDGADAVNRCLLEGSPEEVAQRHARLARALARFDAATITTTHGFCAEALGSLGLAGDDDRDATLLADAGDLVEEVVDDLLVRKWAGAEASDPTFDRSTALSLARAVVDDPIAPIVPDPGGSSLEAERSRFAHAVRRELEERKRRARVMTYDDLLTRLRDVLRDPLRGPSAAATLRERFHVVLVDEFQDTDPAQWEVVRTAFSTARALVLIGDPKQAIYAFRGADVHAYLEAVDVARERATLGVNHRSDGPLLAAFDGLLGDATLGDARIRHRHVEPAPEHRAARLADPLGRPPLRVRIAHRDDGLELTAKGYAKVGSAREAVALDVAAEAVRLLSSGVEVDGARPLAPGDLAVLVRTNLQAGAVHAALRDAGVPAVSGGAGSVFATAAAGEWLALLEALERPSQGTRASAAALTCFLGWTARELGEATDADREGLHRRLHAWARTLRDAGVASLVERLRTDAALAAQVLSTRGGERHLTDVLHVGELLHRAASAERMGPTALAAWLRGRLDEVGTEEEQEERTRRLESDAEAVQVLTVHRSKGLEFGVVLCPYLWDARRRDASGPVTFHDAAAGGRRTVDVALDGQAWEDHHATAASEAAGEDLRLLYVAVTRARHAVVLWWAGSWDSRLSPLSRVALGRGADGSVPDALTSVPGDPDAMDLFGALADLAPGSIGVERAKPEHGLRWDPPAAPPAALAAATFDRELDPDWRRTSYTAIVADVAHDAGAAAGAGAPGTSEPEADVLDDEPDEEAAALGAAPGAGSSPWEAVPGGRRLGTTVHLALEEVDYAADDLGAELAAALADAPLDPAARAALRDGLERAIATPLGAVLGAAGGALRTLTPADRLDELGFELPLAGGDAPVGHVSPAALADVLDAHLPADDVLAGYGARLRADVPAQRLRGFLTGAIDLVARTPDGRFVVVDYKTNRLPGYGGDDLRDAMVRSHYGLQALLYLVALHRYLRWRLRSYDPERHLGGAAYLFLRGMDGDTGAGVFAWRPPAAAVLAASDLLDAGDA